MSTLDHNPVTTQVWDGRSFDYVSPEIAASLAEEGKVQITGNLSASQLLPASSFPLNKGKIEDRKVEPETEPAKKAPAKKKTYNTRQMKAEK